jgi:tetratricopeptide (TPR) repeat protein
MFRNRNLNRNRNLLWPAWHGAEEKDYDYDYDYDSEASHRDAKDKHAMSYRLQPIVCSLLLGLLAGTPPLLRADEPSIEISVNRDRIYLGESFILNVKVAGGDQRQAPEIPDLHRCRVRVLGSQDISNYSITIINGRMQRQGFSGRVYALELTPEEAGTFRAGTVTARAGGKVLTGIIPEVTVTGVTRQEIVSIGVTASRSAVLVDEPFDITLNVRIRCLSGNYASTEPLFPNAPPVLTVPYLDTPQIDGLKGPDIGALLQSALAQPNQPGLAINNQTVQDGFFSQRLAAFLLHKQPITTNGIAYLEYRLQISYTPAQEGAYTFGPVVFKGQVPVTVDDRGQASGTEVFAVGPAVTVRVIPPPEESRPESYVGAIGSNLMVQATLDAQTCNVGDPLTLTLILSGPVSMGNVVPPHLSLQTNLLERFEIYDDSVKTVKKDTGREYAYTIRPRQAGSMELPPIAVSYYDVNARAYRTAFTEPLPIKVRPSMEVTASQIIGTMTSPVSHATRTTPELDLAPAGLSLDPRGARPASLWGSTPLMLALLGTGPVIFAGMLTGAWAWRRRAAHRQSRRVRSARRHAERSLRQLSSAHIAPAPCHLLLCATLRTFLRDRLSVPAAALTPADMAALLRQHGATPERAEEFRLLMERHFNCGYGTPDAPPAAQEINAACGILTALDRELARPAASGTGPATGLVRLLPWLLAGWALQSPLSALALTLDESEFVWNEANTALASARGPRDTLAAAEQYQRLVDAGVRNAPLFFNQGTAFLLAGRYEDAIRILARAERYAGHRSDITRNLQIARARKAGLKTRVTLWERVLLFWHYRLPAELRFRLAAVGFSALWLALALRQARRKGAARWLMAVALLLLMLFGSSAVTTLVQEHSARRPVFTMTGP